ncbi:solute carrier family 2, facilitated glucose transporter member 12-like [Amblyomma americanum]
MAHRKKSSLASRGSRGSLAAAPPTVAVPLSSSEEVQSPPFNAAMDALRRMRPPAKGATPVTDPDSAFPFGHHVQSMLLACCGALGAGTTLGFASVAMVSIEHQPWYNVTPNSPPHNRWIADSLLLGATLGALMSGLLLHLVGYRRMLLLSSGGLAGLWIFLAVSSSVSLIIAGRVASGVCLGVVTNCACLYVADVSPPSKRAFFGSLVEVC